MKKIIVLLSALGLVACSKVGQYSPNLESQLQNPLFAERFAEEMVQGLVELQIQNNPILEDEAKKKYTDDNRVHWLEVAKKARREQNEGMIGNFVEVNEYSQGEALYLKNSLYFGSTFEVTPAPTMRVYLSSVLDPRDQEFPDTSAVDLGLLKSPYGVQQYNVPVTTQNDALRTVVLYETTLERIIGFAQLNGR